MLVSGCNIQGYFCSFRGGAHPQCYTGLHVVLMGTITTRQCKSGALRYTAQIRLKLNGHVIHAEARTFGTATRAREWVRNREAEVYPQIARTRNAQSRPIARGVRTSDRNEGGKFQRPPIASLTLTLLIDEFGSGQILLENCRHYFGMKPQEAKRAATRQALPVPAFRLGSQKSPWLISAVRLAEYIDAKNLEAQATWERIHSI